MAIFCSRYLTSYPFSDGLEASSVRDSALSGYYGFHDYAVAFWHHHIGSIVADESDLTADLRMDVHRSAIQLLENYATTPLTDSEAQSSTSLPVPTGQDVRALMETWRSNSSEAFPAFERRTSTIRRVIESINPIQLDDRAKAALLELVGLPRFKCPKIQCLRFADGFPNQRARDSHVKEHERPFKCSAEGCYARISGFSYQSDLDAHVERFHADDTTTSTLFPRPKGRKESSIFTACSRGDLEEVKAFHSKGVSLDTASRDGGGQTPLVVAAKHGHVHVCAYLINHGADVYHFTYGDTSPLADAIKRGDYQLFLFLSRTAGRHARSLDDSFNKHAAMALNAGSHGILEELLTWHSTPSLRLALPVILEKFCSRKPLESILDTALPHKLFAQAFPSLYESNGAILRPVSQQERENLELDDWYNVLARKYRGSTLLCIACSNENYRAAAFLLDLLKPEDLTITNRVGYTPLLILAGGTRDLENYVHVAQRLIRADNGMAANIRTPKGLLPLHYAIQRSNYKISEFLLDYTRDLDEVDALGRTALEMAVRWNSPSIVTQLLATGRVDIMKRNKDGQTILSVAAGCQGATRAIMELLYSARAYLAYRSDDTPDCLTPLHHALVSTGPNREEKIKYILSLPELDEVVCAFLSSPVNDNPERWTQLLQFALENGFDAVAKSLLSFQKSDEALQAFLFSSAND
jgi:ankyrin repeat protein